MLVGGIVVDDEMDVQLSWHIGFDVTQEGEKLLVTMAGFALSDDRRRIEIKPDHVSRAIPAIEARKQFAGTASTQLFD